MLFICIRLDKGMGISSVSEKGPCESRPHPHPHYGLASIGKQFYEFSLLGLISERTTRPVHAYDRYPI